MYSTEQLIAYLSGETSPEVASAIRQARMTDAATASSLLRLESLLADVKSLGAESNGYDVGPDQNRALLKLWETRPLPVADRLQSFVKRVFARLSFDSMAPGLVPAPFRGDAPSRQLSLEFEGGTLDLSILPAPKPGAAATSRVIGRCRSADVPIEIRATQLTAGHVTSAPVDEEGFFEIEIPSAPHDFVLVLSDAEVVVSGLDPAQQP